MAVTRTSFESAINCPPILNVFSYGQISSTFKIQQAYVHQVSFPGVPSVQPSITGRLYPGTRRALIKAVKRAIQAIEDNEYG